MIVQCIIQRVSAETGCTVYPGNKLPVIREDLRLPDDVREFYSLCGGIDLFESSSYSVKIVPPEQFTLSNPIVIPSDVIELEQAKGTYENEISNDWYVIADLGNSDYIVIDLNEQRAGRCYRAFWDSYAVEGETPIVAHTFTDLLLKLLENAGEYWYFLGEDFKSLGDAYDE